MVNIFEIRPFLTLKGLTQGPKILARKSSNMALDSPEIRCASSHRSWDRWGGGIICPPPLQSVWFSDPPPVRVLKGLSFFSKMLELFSGRCRWRWLAATTKGLFSQIALLANASPSKLIRLPAGTSASRLQVLLQISLCHHWLNIGWRLFNDWLRISRYQICAHFTR